MADAVVSRSTAVAVLVVGGCCTFPRVFARLARREEW